jgi:hypothetical protein
MACFTLPTTLIPRPGYHQRPDKVPYSVVLAVAALGATSGCTESITPQRALTDPTTVYLVDYGDTARLWLPTQDGFTEWCYGDWRWYAKNEMSFAYGVVVFFVPTQGALGRSEHDRPPDERLVAEVIHAIDVERGAAEELHATLEERFKTNEASMWFNAARGIEFVQDDTAYWLGNQSTTQTTAWLRGLGCRCDGFAIVAKYTVSPPLNKRARGPCR